MIQLTEEQSKRLAEIREQMQSCEQGASFGYHPMDLFKDLKFALSLLDSDSQAATLHYFKNGGDGRCITCSNLKLWQYHVDEEIDPATSMRDKCVEKMESYRQRIQYEPDEGVREALFGDMVLAVGSLTLN